MDRVTWEDAVTDAVERMAEVTRSDAQAIVEGQQSLLNTAWLLGERATVADTAAAILHKATRSTGVQS